ncbi:TrbI/VirB10 family protein [Porphyrobacter sp. ULC335]|uniref:TrbI/VirB10 family protein n=1 Tax=Porphyrobacter sp. ULC335 TaxID=2854260 RepID=UPI002220789C|nr:TrbI/VirB10 family protein [Porphyrobacter sp. ULC335]
MIPPGEQLPQAAAKRPEHPEDPETVVRLHGDHPRVVRLSRKAVGLASAAALALVGGALIFALRSPSGGTEPEVYNTGGIAVADGLASAPTDYSKVPRLGPPLPGDLGKPILDAQDRGAVAELPPAAPSAASVGGPDPGEQARMRREQEREAVRVSGVFTGAGSRSDRLAASPAPPSDGPAVVVPADAGTAPAGIRDRVSEPQTRSAGRLGAAASEHTLLAGSVIPAALITGIRSDQPGLVTAQVTQNVYDSVTGSRLLVPQGARLVGDYESEIGFGQRRVLLAWNRLIMPDGRSIELDRQPAADPSGFAGLEDRVDYHWGGVLKAAFVSTLLGVGGELGAGNDDNLVRALRRGSQDSINRAGEQIVSRELAIRPTLTIRPGYPVRVMVTRDIEFGTRE